MRLFESTRNCNCYPNSDDIRIWIDWLCSNYMVAGVNLNREKQILSANKFGIDYNVYGIFQAIFGNDEYVVRGGGGDFTTPGSTYQYLHADLGNTWMPGSVLIQSSV